jgi:hypothetical protein
MTAFSDFPPSAISHDRAKKGTVMLIVISLFAAAGVARGVWVVLRLMSAVPRSNADFQLPGAA